jgi:hypothetical protein
MQGGESDGAANACSGNLVDMGKLAFAPATPEVLRLAHHLDASHELFHEAFHGVFRSEADAEAFIAANTSSALWALVVFDRGPSAAGAGERQLQAACVLRKP